MDSLRCSLCWRINDKGDGAPSVRAHLAKAQLVTIGIKHIGPVKKTGHTLTRRTVARSAQFYGFCVQRIAGLVAPCANGDHSAVAGAGGFFVIGDANGQHGVIQTRTK